ncbi:hypothetical protein LJK87_18155 [Paenibacillus sp. P25]|nr:hypothetical protein LJK87_18155 [Paenibacillus sp. P25]
MGDRDSLWMLLFTIRSLTDAVSVWEYTQMILRTDQMALKSHTEAVRRLKTLQTQLKQTEQDLEESKNRFLMERARLTALQQELDRDLSASSDAERLQRQMQELNDLWKNKGVPLFKSYFQALAKAMQQLPDMLSAPVSASTGSASGSKAGGHLIMNGLNYTFELSDVELNDFLRQKNELFRNLTFHFGDNQVFASGRQDGMDISIKGSYRMAVKNDGKPYIRFQLNELKFNGYLLPQSTAEELERDIDLGIYPQKIAPFLQATGVKLEENKLSIYLKLAL